MTCKQNSGLKIEAAFVILDSSNDKESLMTAEILKNAISHNIVATVATICLMIYFLGTAIVFIAKPLKYGKNYSIQPVDNAGKT